MRLDQAIAVRYTEVSRRKARELIGAHRVLVNERPVSIASRDVKTEDRIVIIDVAPEVAVLAVTDQWIAIDKPAGIATQPGRHRSQPSVDELVRVQLKQRGASGELYVVHRLDAPTSGVVLFARTRATAATLSEMFASRAIRKTYLALLEGLVLEETVVETPVDGKNARTVLHPLRADANTTLAEVNIDTGRMHQIRIHAASIGRPVVGDRRYGTGGASRLMLHGWKLEHEMFGVIEAPPPEEFGLSG